jgi:hypothetical protein
MKLNHLSFPLTDILLLFKPQMQLSIIYTIALLVAGVQGYPDFGERCKSFSDVISLQADLGRRLPWLQLQQTPAKGDPQ